MWSFFFEFEIFEVRFGISVPKDIKRDWCSHRIAEKIVIAIRHSVWQQLSILCLKIFDVPNHDILKTCYNPTTHAFCCPFPSLTLISFGQNDGHFRKLWWLVGPRIGEILAAFSGQNGQLRLISYSIIFNLRLSSTDVFCWCIYGSGWVAGTGYVLAVYRFCHHCCLYHVSVLLHVLCWWSVLGKFYEVR